MAQLHAVFDSSRNIHIRKAMLKNKSDLIVKSLILVWLAAVAQLGNAYKQEGCTFPSKWAGRWFQSGVTQQIIIEGDRLSSKGKCLASERDKYLLVDDKKCYRCVVIHEKHINVLQYKETFCLPRGTLSNLCSLITGDALLYSMFRENASPVPCPLRGPFSFTYNRGHGECKSPVSSIESCTEESRLLLNYQACPDVHGSESTVEELECLATWKEGSQRYLVGKVHHSHATSNEDRYRCFVYEKTNGIVKEGEGIEYNVAQSGDATCNGLSSATEGSRTMALKRVPVAWKCRFPSWMTFPGHWHTLDYSSTYSFHQKNATLRITNQTGVDIKVHCVHIKSSSVTDALVTFVAHWQHHCLGRYVCLSFYRRSTHVAEIQIGRRTIRSEDACSPSAFDPTSIPYITLVTSNPESKDCPYSGKFAITGLRIHQRNARSLEMNTSKSDDLKSHHKHGKKHKHLDNNDDGRIVSTVERRKQKYQRFLEKIFAKEALKKTKQKDKSFTRINNSTLISDLSMDNKTVSNMTSDQVINLQQNLRNRRSSGNVETNACVNHEFTTLDIGCSTHETMEFHSSCDNREFITAYSCHGGWSENGTSFLITTPLTRDSIGAKRFCFVYKESNDKMIHFTRSSVDCDRSLKPGVDGALVFNTTTSGECLETSSARINKIFIDCAIAYFILWLATSHMINTR